MSPACSAKVVVVDVLRVSDVGGSGQRHGERATAGEQDRHVLRRLQHAGVSVTSFLISQKNAWHCRAIGIRALYTVALPSKNKN